MQKINFKDLPSTETPINSTNLNTMQRNTETAINQIVESGSNINGNWIKFSDGTLYQTGQGQCPASVGYAEITFPIAFADNNYSMIVNHLYSGKSEFGGSSQLTNITSPQKVNNNSAYIYSYKPDGNIANFKRNVVYFAIGRWE